eukprot:2400929-Amphidinium_carterae.2
MTCVLLLPEAFRPVLLLFSILLIASAVQTLVPSEAARGATLECFRERCSGAALDQAVAATSDRWTKIQDQGKDASMVARTTNHSHVVQLAKLSKFETPNMWCYRLKSLCRHMPEVACALTCESAVFLDVGNKTFVGDVV